MFCAGPDSVSLADRGKVLHSAPRSNLTESPECRMLGGTCYMTRNEPSSLPAPQMEEDPRFLTEQIVTYLGNKRSLLHFLGTGLEQVKKRLGKERLKADDPFGGYQSLIRDLKSGLSRISEGKKIRPMDIDDGTVSSRFFTDLLMAFVIMAIPTALMTWHQVRKMKTKVQQSNADQYTADGGLELTEKRDIFLYTTMTKTEKPKNDDNDSDSGSFSSGGESFSGSSSDY